MNKIYQIFIKGADKTYPSSEFKASSKTVFTHTPSQDDIDAFVKKCATEINFLAPTLDISKPYKTFIVELDLVDNA